MKIVTEYVDKDEGCWGLFEGPRNIPRRGHRWIQCVYVIRGDAVAEYATDLGPAEDFERIQPLLIPSFGENTVAQLQEFALRNRNDEYWANRRDEMLAESTLISDHIDQLYQEQAWKKRRSQLGPLVTAQRNG
jgi:hypothetical protein